MDKLEVGMYVRTKKGISKIISRVNDPTNYFYKFWKCDVFLELYDDTEYIHEKDIIGESSYNIIDLIEVGDYVNGHTVKIIKEDKNKIDIGEGEDYFWLRNQDIKSIVTKEQFESIKYEVSNE